MRGRKPKPTWLKVVAGNPGHRPLNDAEPVPEGDLTDPPEWMSDSQKAIWRTAIQQAPAGLLRCLDESVLSVWVVAADLHRDAAQRVARLGTMVRSPNTQTPMQNPYVAVVNKQAAIMLKAASEMGFTPSARSRVRVEKPKGRRNNGGAFDDLPDLGDV